jgi:selenoprotein W-related protein
MVEHLLAEFEQETESITLVPGGGGVFEVTLDGDLVYSKKATGRHAEPDDVLGPVRERTG